MPSPSSALAYSAAFSAAFSEQEVPNGFATEVGERGIRLSGGARQRIGQVSP